ncbi:MAG TPA: hypothetical protein VFS20_16615 [Longimicrobium sp.]|nr:hypothetical protein [Longimicrobium sp.]
MVGENGRAFARRLLDANYGPGNWSRDPTSEFNKIQKFGEPRVYGPSSPGISMTAIPVQPADDGPSVYLIGLRLCRTTPVADLYDGDVDGQDRPLTRDGDVVWFATPELASSAMDGADEAFRSANLIIDQTALVVDFPRVLRLVAEGKDDPDGTVVNALNVLLDIVPATGFSMTVAQRKALSELADHATFSTEIGAFLDQPEHRREAVLDAIVWCVGAVALNSAVSRAVPAKEPAPAEFPRTP